MFNILNVKEEYILSHNGHILLKIKYNTELCEQAFKLLQQKPRWTLVGVKNPWPSLHALLVYGY